MTDISTVNQRVGEKIRYFRRARNYTLTQLGEKIYKSKSTISKYETGEISIDISTLYEIASVLQVSPLNFLVFDEKEEPKATTVASSKSRPAEKFYLYTYNGLAREPLRRHILLVGDTWAEQFADVYDYENPTQCAFHYQGEAQRTESSVRLYMENLINPSDRCFLSYPTTLTRQEYLIGMLTSFSISQYPTFSIKVLLSYEEQKDEQWLKERLLLTKEEIRNIRKRNIFYFDQLDLIGRY